MIKSKKYRLAKSKINQESYPIEDAINLIKETASAKFDESVEVHFNLGIDPKKSEQIVRGVLSLPHGTGRAVKVCVFTLSQDKEAKLAGADLIGGKELIDQISATNKIEFDVAVATPDIMRDLAKIAKILGVKGLMPSPKNGTITENIGELIPKLKAGQVNYRNDDSGNVHQIIGKKSWEAANLITNFNELLSEIKRQRPKGIKGSFIRSITLCTTMGPGLKIKANL